MMNLRYYSNFQSLNNTRYRVEIWQEPGGMEIKPREIVLTSEPVDIEWEETSKLEPVQCSSATLNLVSMLDREFLDLYTVEVNTVRLDIYRNNALYWSGMLDPEIFEEPYAYKDRYVTTVTFSDFAILSRKKWDGRGVFTLQEVLDRCVMGIGFRYGGLMRLMSTERIDLTEGSVLLMDTTCVIGENFYDEEDEPMSLREVLEEILRPFGLRIIQKNGWIYLYDLNTLHTQSTKLVGWSGVDATLSADVVYNNVKVTFSPYSSSAMIDGTLEHDDILKERPIGSSGELIRTDRAVDSPEGFRVVCGDTPVDFPNLTIGNGAVPFRIDPEYSGGQDAGVMWGYRPDEDGEWRGYPVFRVWEAHDDLLEREIITTARCYIGTSPNPEKWRLKISMDVLFDVRYNPFESAEDNMDNEHGNWKKMKNWCNYAYIPIELRLYDSEGKALYRYKNKGTVGYPGLGRVDHQWVEASVPYNYYPDMWLCYYNQGNRTDATGLGGWASNRPIIGRYPDDVPSALRVLSTGEYIELPPVNGYLELRVYPGIASYDNSNNDPEPDIYPLARWMAYKSPKVELVKANGREVDKKDVEDSAWLNKDAKEDMEIDTIFGTMPESVPSARGLLLDIKGNVLTRFRRAGRTDRLERLLIGTAYSQHASRKHILSGAAKLIPEFTALTDVSSPDQYILMSEIQHLMQDESEVRMVQFGADNYEAIEYKS